MAGLKKNFIILVFFYLLKASKSLHHVSKDMIFDNKVNFYPKVLQKF